MKAEPNVEVLETALLARAKHLAEKYLILASHSRDRIIKEANERLRLREEREVLAAKEMADRVYQQQVQAGELKLQGKLDRLRWELIQAVIQDIHQRLTVLSADKPRYLPILQRLLSAATAAIEQEDLIAEFNQQDLKYLEEIWESFVTETVPDKRVALSPNPLNCSGGVRVVSKDYRMRVDNTFEGRLNRLTEELYQIIIERLFPQSVSMERVPHG
jgi:V/A-type H+-transporting ATPase subunit E